MNRLLAVTALLSLSGLALAREVDDHEEDKRQQVSEEISQERMEEEPSSTTIGGSRGGQLEMEKKRDDLRNQKTREDYRLFETDGLYRRGF